MPPKERNDCRNKGKSSFSFFFVHPLDVASAYCSHVQCAGVQLHGAYYLTLFARTRVVSLMHAHNICRVAPRVTTGVNRTKSDFPPFLKTHRPHRMKRGKGAAKEKMRSIFFFIILIL